MGKTFDINAFLQTHVDAAEQDLWGDDLQTYLGSHDDDWYSEKDDVKKTTPAGTTKIDTTASSLDSYLEGYVPQAQPSGDGRGGGRVLGNVDQLAYLKETYPNIEWARDRTGVIYNKSQRDAQDIAQDKKWKEYLGVVEKEKQAKADYWEEKAKPFWEQDWLGALEDAWKNLTSQVENFDFDLGEGFDNAENYFGDKWEEWKKTDLQEQATEGLESITDAGTTVVEQAAEGTESASDFLEETEEQIEEG